MYLDFRSASAISAALVDARHTHLQERNTHVYNSVTLVSMNQRTPFDDAHDLLVSLLKWWPTPPHVETPSALLCGPTSNGKSHLLSQVLQTCQTMERQDASDDTLRSTVVAVKPPLATALTVRVAKDNSTGLRMLLRRQIIAALSSATVKFATPPPSASKPSFTVMVVLDHVDSFLTSEEEHGTDGGLTSSAGAPLTSTGTEADSGSGLGTAFPAFLTDLYTILRSAPPLFTAEECAALQLHRIVYVLLFTGELRDVVPIVSDRLTHFFLELPTPTAAERRRFFQRYLEPVVSDVEADRRQVLLSLADALALRSGGVSYGGLVEMMDLVEAEMESEALYFAPQTHLLNKDDTSDSVSPQPPVLATLTSTADVVGTVAQRVRKAYQTSGSITALEYRRSAGYVDVQATRWSDIAGMAEVKATLQRLVTAPLQHFNTYARFGVRPSIGILLHGPPGTGKTMLAKAMATELNASFIYLDLPELVQSEVGESERRLSRFFAIAKERSPAVMFVDELQAAFGRRYGDVDPSNCGSAAPTAHDARLVSQLLRLLDDAYEDEDHVVLFVGATNVVQLLDPLLLRPGRLDTILEVPLPDLAAREHMTRQIVCGEWARWFDIGISPEADGRSIGEAASQVAAVQNALIKLFVDFSEGCSGAELRNFTAVFAMQLMQEVARAKSVVDAEVVLGQGAEQARELLRTSIYTYLAVEGRLSPEAVELVTASRQKALATS